MSLKCLACGYDGDEGFSVGMVGQTERGDDIDGWFCIKCGQQVCTEGEDCPPDEFGQYLDEPGGFTRNIYDE